MAWRGAGGFRLRWVALSCLVGTVIVAACATGGGEGDGDESGGSSSSTGSGGEAGVAGAGGFGGFGGTGGTGGTEPPCPEDPCKLVMPQCGCDPVEKCALAPADGTRSCVADGTVDVGGECSGNCKAGGLCLTWSSFSQCFKYCATDDDCSGFGSICIMQLQEDYPERFCSVNCDPPSGNGCDVAGTKCEALYSDDDFKWFTLCAMAGAGTHMADCSNGLEDCADGYGCFNDGNQSICLQYCNMDSPSCAAGTCQDITNPITIGTAHYGVCF